MKAEIISVGTELLLGDIVNTNAQYLSQRLASLGISVYRQTTVGDNRQRFTDAIRSAFENADMIITTGGLGPTQDDLTKETVFEYFSMTPVIHQPSFDAIKNFFTTIGMPMAASNEKQAAFPIEAEILKNDHGTAPGCIIEKNGKIAVLLPGPPREMKPMFENKALPLLSRYSSGVLISEVFNFIGIGESSMEEKVKDLIDLSNPTVAPYAKDGFCQLRVTANGKDDAEARTLIVPIEADIRARFGDDLFGFNDTSIEEETAKLLIEKKVTIATAESCTGGLIASRLVNFPGISEVFLEGVVAYANAAKTSRLGVPEDVVRIYGAVSEETARSMAEGICKTSGAALGISTTGIAGPDGGTNEKPVGLVYIGLCINGRTNVQRFTFTGSRQRIRERAAMTALDMIRRALLIL